MTQYFRFFLGTSEWFAITRNSLEMIFPPSCGSRFNQDEQLSAFCWSSAQHAGGCFSCGPVWVLQSLFVCFLHSKFEMNSDRHSITQKQSTAESLRRVSPVRKSFELVAGALWGGVSDQRCRCLKNLRIPESIPNLKHKSDGNAC